MGVENQKYGEDWIQNVMNSEIKILSELNDKQKEITDKLDKPKKIADILDKVKNQLLKITKKEDIQYYKDFLITVQNNIKDKVAPETITPEDISKDTYKSQLEYTDINTAIQTMLDSLSQKEQEFLAQDIVTTPILMTEPQLNYNNKEQIWEIPQVSAENEKTFQYLSKINKDQEKMKALWKKYFSEDDFKKRESWIKGSMSQWEWFISSFMQSMINNPWFKEFYWYIFNEANGKLMSDEDYKNVQEMFSYRAWTNFLPVLQDKISSLTDKEIISFKEVVESLKNGKVSIEQLDPLDKMTDIILIISMMDKKYSEKIIPLFDTIVKDKFPNMLNSKEYGELKDILWWLLQRKDILIDFATTVQDDIKWLSYDTLLKTEKLDSDDAKKSINTIFHRDEKRFNKLVQDFNDPQKKWSVEKIVKEYVQLSLPKENLEWTTIEIGEVVLKDWEGKDIKKPCFNVMKDGKIVEVSTWKQDDKGQDIKQKITPFFGDAKNWKSLMLKETIEENQWVRDAMGIWPDNMKQLDPKLKDIMNSTINTKNWPKSISEAISSLFESPLFLEIKQAFLALLSMLGDDADKQTKYAIEANFAQAERDISKIKETIKDKNGNQISYLKALKALNLENKDMGGEIGNPKERFANAPLINQKDYIEQVTADPNIRYNKDILDKLWNKVSQSETVASDENKENKNGVTLVEWKETIIWTHKVIKQWDYYLIDGKPSDGTIFVKNADGKLTKKTLKVDNTDFESQDVTLIPNETIATLYPKNSEALAQGKEDVFRYYALESSGDIKNPNPIDELLKLEGKPDSIDKIISTMKKKLTWLDSTKRTKLEIQKIFQEWLNELQWVDMWDNKTQYNTALNKRATAVGIETSNIATVTPKPSDTSKKT